MGWPVVTVTSGGIPVTDNSALGYGVVVDEAANGMGTAITYVAHGGLPVVLGGAQVPQPPTGFVFLVDPDGTFLTDPDGSYLIEAA